MINRSLYLLLALSYAVGSMHANNLTVDDNTEFHVSNLTEKNKLNLPPLKRGWNKIDQTCLPEAIQWKNVDSTRGAICSYEAYRPTFTQAENKELLVTLIHGTWSKADSCEYMSTDEEDSLALLPMTKEFAKQMAIDEETVVHVVTFGWSGIENDLNRKCAGKVLAAMLNDYFPNYRVVTIAHSHGGNVVNHASRFLKNIVLKLVVNMGTPVILQGRGQLHPDYVPNNMQRLMVFYSVADMIHWIGGSNPQKTLGQNLSFAASYIGNSLSNIISRNKSKNEQATNNELPSDNLSDEYANGWYNLFFEPKRKIETKKAEFKQKRIDAKVYTIKNIRLQVDGWDPDHGSLKQHVLKNLRDIYQQVFGYYSFTEDLDLNINTKPNRLEEKLQLAIRHEFYHDFAKYENSHSEKQKATFKRLYGKDIGYKGNLFTRAWRNIYNVAVLA